MNFPIKTKEDLVRQWTRIVGVASVVLLAALPARAADATAFATLAFDGTVTFPAMPCEPSESQPCRGSIDGDWAGRAFGRFGTRPFELTWKTSPGAFAAAFEYTERSCDGSGGRASGTATATAGPGTMTGTWAHGGRDTFPRAIVDLQAQFTFEWARRDGQVAIDVDDFVLSFTVAGLDRPVEVKDDAVELTALMPSRGCGGHVTSPITGAAAVTHVS